MIVVLTTLGFKAVETVTGFRHWWGSPPHVLLSATIVTVMAGFVGGYLRQ